MRQWIVDGLLLLAVTASWLGAVAFGRLRAPLDRLHIVGFVNAAGGLALLAAAVVTDGASARVLKIVLLEAAVLTAGAALAHGTGRALVLRRRR